MTPVYPRFLLHRMTLEHPTEFWNDGCEPTTLARALEQGATGATSNPVLVLEAIQQDRAGWIEHTKKLLRDFPTETEEQVAWRVVEEAASRAADLLLPLFQARGEGAQGRLSLQVSPRNHPNARAMVDQAAAFSRLRPNMAVKVPAVAAGVAAVEELIALGIPVNATVLFTLPQAIAIAEAMERGMARAKRAVPCWVTIMVGRLDDHLRDQAKERGLAIDPEHVRQASTAVMRRAYGLFKRRGYRAKLLAAAMRSHHHWSEFIGGEVVVTIPPSWQDKFNASGVDVRARMSDEVDPAVVAELEATFPDFHRAYVEDGIAPQDFVTYGATRKTLHQFLAGYDTLLGFVRGVMLPLPA